VAHGTFMDGLWYDTISRNLSIGIGSFWRPIFTPTLSVPYFADHPPLVFAIESAFFRVLGDHWWVGKFYGFVTLLAAASLVIALWRAAGGALRDGWLPLLFWLSAPLVTWSFSNEMLENTMLLFQLGAAWAFVLASSRYGTRGDLLAVLGGALLFGAVMCKGAVAPFPLVMPVVLAMLLKRGTPRGAVVQTFLALATAGVLLWLVLQIPDARAYWHRYTSTNFLPLVSGQRGGVDNRLHIVGKLFLELAPMLALTALVAWAGWPAPIKDERRRLAGAFVVTGLAGSLPLALSPIQSGFYLVPCFAFFALGLALLVEPRARELVVRLGRWDRVVTALATLLVLGGLGYSASRIGKIDRGGPVIRDVRAIGRVVPRGQTVGICPSMGREWSLHGYFMLYDRIALDASGSLSNEWFVADTTQCDPAPWYEPAAATTAKLRLYRAP
jgi:hypothetical protein